MKKKARWISWISVIVIVLGLIGWQVFRRVSKPQKKSTPEYMSIPVAVEVTAVQKKTIRDLGSFTGTLFPKSQFIVAPKISGRLVKLMVHIGDRVKRNQLIALLDDEEYAQQVVQAQADLQVAQANLEEALSSLEIAKRGLERSKTLHERGIASDSELDAAQAAYQGQDAKYKVSVAQVAHKEAALKAAQVRLSYTRISTSWENGSVYRVVGERFVDEGAMLTSNTPILSILEIQPIIAAIHLTDKDYFRVKRGQTAIVTSHAFPGREFNGKIARIAPLLKETSREARIEIEIPNPVQLLKPGMFINAQIEFTIQDSATVVPVSALVKRQNKQGIFLADTQNLNARFVPLTLGIVSGEWAEVLEPSSLSGFVVTLGQHLLGNGRPITLPPDWEKIPVANTSDSQPSSKGQQPRSGDKK
ncbi:MAG: efflux RND transporter periplasmic adaptor subunit [Candidatus Aminicenantes bacterium]|nr:efflux RND transporter periplasmic adaptor subunit [Candidatus Aminicenantes bacterium]